MTKTNSKGYSIGTPICFGVGGPIVRKPVLVLAGTPRGGWAQSSRAMQFLQGGMGFYPIPFLIICQVLINIFLFINVPFIDSCKVYLILIS